MLYDIKLRITYEVGGGAASGRTVLRVLPRDVAGVQRVFQSHLTADPAPDERHQRLDFFGNPTINIDHQESWTELAIVMEARVERLHRQRQFDFSPTLPEMYQQILACRDLGGDSPLHFTVPSSRTPTVASIADFASDSTRQAAHTFDAVHVLNRAIFERMTFDSDATNVNTPAAEAFAHARGVCQDFTHIMIIGLRSLGIPAGYVSGYLRTIPPAGKPRLEGADAMHAWVRAWCGAEVGWVEFDPTNNVIVGVDHIVAGYGRDYADVSPVRGVLRTAGDQETDQSVDVIPLE